MASSLDRGKTVTKPQAGPKPWQNTRVSNISELRSQARESKLVKTEPGRATGILLEPNWCQALDSIGCQSRDEHLLSGRSEPGGTGDRGLRQLRDLPQSVDGVRLRVCFHERRG